MFSFDRAADNSFSIDLALAFTGGGYFDYKGKVQQNPLSLPCHVDKIAFLVHDLHIVHKKPHFVDMTYCSYTRNRISCA
jgi:hypothetical protein